MGEFKIKKRLILTGLALLLAMDGALAYYNSRLAVRDENPDMKLKEEARQVAWMKADVERANKSRRGCLKRKNISTSLRPPCRRRGKVIRWCRRKWERLRATPTCRWRT